MNASQARPSRLLHRMAMVCVAVLAAATLSSCSAIGMGDAFIVASTNFSETRIIANMYQQVLAAHGVDARVKELTTREIIAPALQKGELQATPEYLGSFTEYLNKKTNGPDAPQVANGNTQQTLQAGQALAAPRQITLLTPSPAQDQNAFAVTADFAARTGIRSLSELATWSQTNKLILGGPPECPKRPFCLPGLEGTYGAKVAQFVPLDAGGPLTVQALNQGKITTGVIFSSSAAVSANNYLLLVDDKGLQTVENLTPAVYSPALTDEVRRQLDAVSAALTTEDLRNLNSQVDEDRKNPRLVAEEFLKSKGLL